MDFSDSSNYYSSDAPSASGGSSVFSDFAVSLSDCLDNAPGLSMSRYMRKYCEGELKRMFDEMLEGRDSSDEDEDRPPPPPRRIISRDRTAGHVQLMKDYFDEFPTFTPNLFCRRF
ncbi:hypothetical protein DFS34DRAFT_691144 [Phlyctochytrium arcticum]|nr:hypothetical protein DFS34DRAFT_691144 [Phlyctochytrium arcticum]